MKTDSAQIQYDKMTKTPRQQTGTAAWTANHSQYACDQCIQYG